MEEESLAYQLHSGRIADFILCSQQPYVRYSSMQDCLPASEDRDAFRDALRNDPYDRFCCIENLDDMLIGLKNITEDDARLQADVEWWRSSILQYLERIKVPVELGRIASLVERPAEIPRNIRLKDIINSDPGNRFTIQGAPDRLMLSKRISPDEIEESKEIWRKRIHDFLYMQLKDLTLTTLGSSVARPSNLGGGKTKLLELLQSDPEERFHLIYRSTTETIVRVKLTDAQREWLHEKWRLKAANCLLEQKRTMSLTDLGASVKRPSVHLGSASSLRTVLLEDPQSRFILSGQGDNIRVRISADAELGTTRRSRSHSSASADPLEWNHVTRRTTRGTAAAGSTSVSTSANKSGRVRQHRTTEAELDAVSARQTRWNVKQGSAERSASEPTRQAVMASPTTTEMSGEGTSAATDSPDATFNAHGSSWEWRNPLEDLHVRASLFSSSETPHSTAPSARRSATALPTLSNGLGAAVRPSYRDKLLPPTVQKAISRPTATSSISKGKGSSLSPDAAEYTPGAGLSGSQAGINSSGAVGESSRRTEEWLPSVLVGFEPELVRGFAGRMQAEGFLCVRDLVMARALGQLTTDYLSAMGFKIGHCNRIFAALPMT
jgi:hypothetical protein